MGIDGCGSKAIFKNYKWREGALGAVYRYHDISEKRRLWQELLDAKAVVGVSCIVMGDFNKIRNLPKRKGYMELSRSMVEFEE